MSRREPRPGTKRARMLQALESGDKTTLQLAALAGLNPIDAAYALRIMSEKGLCHHKSPRQFVGAPHGGSYAQWWTVKPTPKLRVSAEALDADLKIRNALAGRGR